MRGTILKRVFSFGVTLLLVQSANLLAGAMLLARNQAIVTVTIPDYRSIQTTNPTSFNALFPSLRNNFFSSPANGGAFNNTSPHSGLFPNLSGNNNPTGAIWQGLQAVQTGLKASPFTHPTKTWFATTCWL